MRILKPLVLIAVIGALGFTGYATRDQWLPLVRHESADAPQDLVAKEPQTEETPEKVLLSDQAIANLGLSAKSIQPTTFWKTIQAPGIRFSMRHAGVLLFLTWVIVGFGVWQLTRLGADFLPKFDEGSVQINVALPGGSSLKASNEASALIDARLQTMQKTPDNPGAPILHFARRTVEPNLTNTPNRSMLASTS
jgi:hypothetical protein